MDDTDYELIERAKDKLSKTMDREFTWKDFLVEVAKMVLDNRL